MKITSKFGLSATALAALLTTAAIALQAKTLGQQGENAAPGANDGRRHGRDAGHDANDADDAADGPDDGGLHRDDAGHDGPDGIARAAGRLISEPLLNPPG